MANGTAGISNSAEHACTVMQGEAVHKSRMAPVTSCSGREASKR
jgi:hypothetical protein